MRLLLIFRPIHRQLFSTLRLGLGLLVLAGGITSARATLLDTWRAADLSGLDDGDGVGSWTSTGGRTLTGAVGYQPQFKPNATPAGQPVVRFNRDWLQMAENNPLAGLDRFSIVFVFRADAPGNDGWQWYQNSGIVDAEQGGVTDDWGTVINAYGQLGLGVGNPDLTLYAMSTPSLVDTNYHVAVLTAGDGTLTIYVDNQWVDSTTGAATAPRNNAGFSLGGINTGEDGANRRFVGDLAEIRFYDTNLTAGAASNVIAELTGTYIDTRAPLIWSFTASTNQIFIDHPVTLSWSTTNATSLAIAPGVGAVGGPAGSVMVSPRTNTTYTLTASNAFGLRTQALTVEVDQGIPVANSLSVTGQVNTTLPLTLTGTDPQGSNLTYQVEISPAHGTLTGAPPHLSYQPATDFSGIDQFTYHCNDGEFDSPAATVAIQVLLAPTAPSAVLITTTNISSSARPGSFLASFRAVDINPGDTHTFTLVPGFGDNSRFGITGNQLLAGDTFAGNVGDTFTIRVRATDSAGLWREQTFTLAITTLAQTVVINELHYNPEDNTVPEEFIELYNPGAAAVDLSGWRFKSGVSYTFPAGTVIAAGGFVVVAEDPATLQSRYGATALGPWIGSLSSDGETVALEDANGKTVNEVDYQPEFPWPVAADGAGASMALVNPGLDNTLGSSWRSEMPPTPGQTNGVFAANAAPNIRQVHHTPQSPTSTNAIVITAKVTDPEGVAGVELQYQIVAPGKYIPATLPVAVSDLIANPYLEPTDNPAFEDPANWTSVAMTDTGTSGDAQAGADIYTVTLPPQANRVLVRYRIQVTDTLGATRRAPFEDDPSLNFACFVYDGIPAYQGTSAADLQSLPVYFLMARSQDVSQCAAYTPTFQLPQFGNDGLAHPSRFVFNWPGTLIYDGVVYDHIQFRLHGANGRYQPGKRNWRFKFNRGNYFAARDADGKLFPHKWSHLSTGKGSSNRLTPTFSLNETLNYFLWNEVGVPAPRTVYFHFRVIQGSAEAPGQYTGDFWGLNWLQEEYDGRFLEAHNLAKGNLYKLINAQRSWDPGQDMVEQQRYQGALAVTNGSDGAGIQDALLGSQTTDWIRAHVNCSEWYAFDAICEGVRNYDFWPSANKNAAWYFAPPYGATNDNWGQFWVLPWDTDSTWGPSWNNGQDLVYNGIFLQGGGHPELQLEYRNTVREVRDLLFQPDQLNPAIDAFAARIAKFVPADLARWSNAPASGGNYVSLSSGAGFVSPALSGGLPGYVKDLKEFMFTGGNHPWWIDRQFVATGGWVTRLDSLAADTAIPAKPGVAYTGPTNYPLNALSFGCTAFSDPQGNNTFAALQWRLAEVYDTNHPAADARTLPPMEWDALWTSGTVTNWSSQVTIPGVYVQTNKLYRVRVRFADNTGRWSHWSDPVQFSVSPADLVTQLRTDLRFSEIMYNPPAAAGYTGDDLEFLELQNTGTNTLDLAGLTFTAGITYTFPASTTLGAGQFFLLGRNAAALQARYPGVTVNDIYTGKLDNGGETLRISTPAGATVLELTYDDTPPWPVTADGMGWSLVWDPASVPPYRASTFAGGSPGTNDPASTTAAIRINEILSHPGTGQADAIELFNPTANAVNVGGWFLSDDPATPKKYRIPAGITLGAGGYQVFTATEFGTGPTGFGLGSTGDAAYLFAGDAATNLTGYVHGTEFGAAATGVSFGRYVNSIGNEDFVAQLTPTLGTANSRPLIGPLVITEIMFDPPALGTNADYDTEFIELQNITATNVALSAAGYPSNTWQLANAVTFQFPANVVVPPGGRLLVVDFDPNTNAAALARFQSTYAPPTNVPLYGPWSGHLDNAGETIELLYPEPPDSPTGTVANVLVEKVAYQSDIPWPAGAAGTGLSLQRATLLAYANDPTNWFTAAPTAGTLSPQTSVDADGDGVPDVWEWQHNTDPYVADRTADPDGDGFSNYAEWLAGTDPHDATSRLQLEAVPSGNTTLELRFTAAADHSYSLLAASDINAVTWTAVLNVVAAPTNRVVSFSQPTTNCRFYRVVAPAQP
ncbi:MAG TPA: lamin tail domain-containing protein [Dongiaceae bacterium]|nr:lamin tail domain-containing protein [Dongiaceae bacterium]